MPGPWPLSFRRLAIMPVDGLSLAHALYYFSCKFFLNKLLYLHCWSQWPWPLCVTRVKPDTKNTGVSNIKVIEGWQRWSTPLITSRRTPSLFFQAQGFIIWKLTQYFSRRTWFSAINHLGVLVFHTEKWPLIWPLRTLWHSCMLTHIQSATQAC